MGCVCAIQRVKWARQKISAFERGMVIGTRRTDLCQEVQPFPVCIKNGPPPKGHPGNFRQPSEALKSTIANMPEKRF